MKKSLLLALLLPIVPFIAGCPSSSSTTATATATAAVDTATAAGQLGSFTGATIEVYDKQGLCIEKQVQTGKTSSDFTKLVTGNRYVVKAYGGTYYDESTDATLTGPTSANALMAVTSWNKGQNIGATPMSTMFAYFMGYKPDSTTVTQPAANTNSYTSLSCSGIAWPQKLVAGVATYDDQSLTESKNRVYNLVFGVSQADLKTNGVDLDIEFMPTPVTSSATKITTVDGSAFYSIFLGDMAQAARVNGQTPAEGMQSLANAVSDFAAANLSLNTAGNADKAAAALSKIVKISGPVMTAILDENSFSANKFLSGTTVTAALGGNNAAGSNKLQTLQAKQSDRDTVIKQTFADSYTAISASASYALPPTCSVTLTRTPTNAPVGGVASTSDATSGMFAMLPTWKFDAFAVTPYCRFVNSRDGTFASYQKASTAASASEVAEYSCLPTSVATIDTKGRITAIAKGTATCTAKLVQTAAIAPAKTAVTLYKTITINVFANQSDFNTSATGSGSGSLVSGSATGAALP